MVDDADAEELSSLAQSPSDLDIFATGFRAT
jgi:hypothetical protein